MSCCGGGRDRPLSAWWAREEQRNGAEAAREARRLELERKLVEYRKSDAYLMKLKYMKLKKSLKEVDERQKAALLRNQTFLKEFDRLEAHMRTSGSGMIQKMEAWYGREIRSAVSLQEDNLSAEGDKEEEHKEQMAWLGRQARISTGAAVLRELYHPATVFMGYHTSAVSATGDLSIWQKPPQPTESSVAPGLPSCCPSLGGLGPESRSADLESHASVEGAAGCEDLAASEEGSKHLTSSASDPELATPEKEQRRGSIPAPDPHLSDQWACKEASGESSVEVPVPASAEEVMVSVADVPQGTASPGASWDAHAVEGSSMEPPNPFAAQEKPSVSSAPDRHCGMLVGLSQALHLIEDVAGRTSPEHRVLYQHVGTVGTAELLSFCNRAGSLKDDDLEECEAVVLHQLQALLQSTLGTCLLPEETLDVEGRVEDEKQTRPDQQWDVEMLRTCLSNHASFLKSHQVQLTEEVAEMFENLLVSSSKAQDGQASSLLREVLPEECEDRSSIQSNESSCSLPLIPNDSRGVTRETHAPRLEGAGEQEVTNWCEDESKEESAVEKILITGLDIGNDGSKAKENQEMQLESSSSSNESLPFSRTETRKGVVAAIKSKAFWGESDDSSSEIEAALRPQTHSTEEDDFDDFYD
ncbi:PREDICTED: centrosomal protein kizuna [Chaetura pelagica]|uniref:centrosomal protein kizuna n=1 Tax=Chaetura pelagica TaxID=8897 RepID=UPI000523896C|nr:PREDICTED: centrosomal protein kizuna [Chaetura pelagica]